MYVFFGLNSYTGNITNFDSFFQLYMFYIFPAYSMDEEGTPAQYWVEVIVGILFWFSVCKLTFPGWDVLYVTFQ